MVERLVAERRPEQAAPRPETRVDAARPAQEREVVAPRVPVIDMERTLRGLDGAVRAIDQKTKGTADSITTIRVQAPTFKASKIASPQQDKN
jgi:hypothetical protein